MTNKKSITDEDATLNFRVPKSLKATIVAKAEIEKITSSKYLRNLLESVHNGSYCHLDKLKSEREDFLFSKEFLQLIVWIYRKRENNSREVDKNDLDSYVKTLKRTENFLPKNLVFELDKVLNNLLVVRVSKGYDGDRFDFPKNYSDDKKFNYEKVEKFLLDENILEAFIERGEVNITNIF
ncbi:hypothetical protein [Psychroserpens ponticola]|uniref:Uncharacterized protein n=1 Tax=Psychroserpens ponticola TaxID=2932268 RepID=A0ABY7RYQ4_9FLAO|nr:hypothetical protein [Psychroserpens ponticola]WCO02288.1 hypothetical protein MUN68_002080 [Psychroserpens ponticola]